MQGARRGKGLGGALAEAPSPARRAPLQVASTTNSHIRTEPQKR